MDFPAVGFSAICSFCIRMIFSAFLPNFFLSCPLSSFIFSFSSVILSVLDVLHTFSFIERI